jgi:hypothetical protein
MAALIVLALALALQSAASPPQELASLAVKARVAPILTWCAGEFESGQPGSFAVAVGDHGAGRYLALAVDGRVITLSEFTGRADLSCYTRAEAEKLEQSIRLSETIRGQIAARWDTSVVCAFTDNTTAHCWQYSPVDRTFVTVGGWTT